MQIAPDFVEDCGWGVKQSPMIRLGPFELIQPLEEGGMGVVWRARHLEQNVPVAVKVISERGLASKAARSAFRDEVAAAAGLHHPGIVLVFDHGDVDAAAAAASRGRLRAGEAFVAMEYASFGSLKSRLGEMPWSQIRSTLLALLDALAHAHARGVVHRDIKPGNVLLAGPDDVRPGLKLADFGLARALNRTDDLESVRGTPLYMASEQISRRWRDFGPWTDLYALGHLAWELATGRAAFRGRTLPGILNGHLTGELPPFQPRVDVPRGLHGWLIRMLQPDPNERFQRAADAAWALAQLADADIEGSGSAIPGVITNPTLTLDDTLMMMVNTADVLAEPAPVEVPDASHPPPAAIVVPPSPPSWKRREPPPPPVQLLGVGLGVFGLRNVPLVGRSLERNTLWEALRACEREPGPQMVALVGAAGNGKTRLVEWISQRAHEVGGAHVVKAVHSPDPTPLDGLGPMLARSTRCMALDRESVASRLAHTHPTDEVEPLLALLCPSAEGVQLVNAEERFVVVLHELRRVAVDRPVVVWLDDVQWGPEALAFAKWLLDEGGDLSVVVLLTAQAEALAERPRATAALEQVLAHPRARRIDLPPLAPRKAKELVRVLLGLEGELATRVAERTKGNPLFTIQLVADWVARGILVPGSQGFALQPGAEIDLPDTLHEVWAARFDRVMAGVPEHRRALEIAAALGQDIDNVEWRAICESGGVPIASSTIELMQEARLVVPTESGWSFTHGMLRESLIRLAKDAKRWRVVNELCASALSVGDDLPHARLGRHLFAAADYTKAASHLIRALSVGSGDWSGGDSHGLLSLLESALRFEGAEESDVRWGRLWYARAAHNLQDERIDDAYRDALRVVNASRRNGWPLLAEATMMMARVVQNKGDLNQAQTLAVRAVTMIRELGDDELLAGSLVDGAVCHILTGELEVAREFLEEATELYRSLEHLAGQARALRYEGDIARLESRYIEAREMFVAASELNTRAGLRADASSTLHGVAEMERLLGNLEAAEPIYRQVVALAEARGRFPEVPLLNLALCLIARGRFEDAQAQLKGLLARWTGEGRKSWMAYGHASLMHATAGLQEWEAFDTHCAQATMLCPQSGVADIDLALAAEGAGTLALAAGQKARASEAFDFAATQWEQLGDQKRADTALAKVSSRP